MTPAAAGQHHGLRRGGRVRPQAAAPIAPTFRLVFKPSTALAAELVEADGATVARGEVS